MAHDDRTLREFETELDLRGKRGWIRANVQRSLSSAGGAHRAVEQGQPICGSRARFALLFATLLGAAGSCPGEEVAEKATRLEEVVIQAKRQAADEQVTQQVQKTLTDAPWIYAEHVIVTTQNGVVRLEGIVGDTGERFRILRLCRKIPGARRVVDALEIISNDADGG
jgi:osmotically-inducible protein OsmY